MQTCLPTVRGKFVKVIFWWIYKMKFKRKYWLVIGIPLLIWFYFCLPEPLFNVPYSTIISSEQGKLIGATTAEDQQWRFPTADSTPYKFEKAILNFEDAYFYSHPGINPVSIGKALIQNIKAGHVVRGGSTISMQVIRLSRNGQPRTYLEKLYECILALRLELRYTKAEILNMYTAHAPFGGNVVGLEAASWRYFKRPPNKLSWAEASALAVLPNAPALIYPGKNHQLLAAKRNSLLDKLVENGVIDATTATLSKEEPLPGTPHALPLIAPHLLARYQLQNPKGIRVQTTINTSIQQTVSNLLQSHHKKMAQNKIYNGAVLVVDTKSGAVKAYVGNTYDATRSHENAVDIIQSARSSGSTLKPFLFSEMQQKGMILPKTLLPDIPTFISGYAPKNFDKQFDGAVPADNALARSLNVPAVRLLQEYGVEIFYDDLQNLKFSTVNRSPANYGLSLILGGAEVTLWDLVKNYRKLGLNVINYHHPSDSLFQMHLSQNEKQVMPTISMDPAANWITLEALKVMDRPIEGTNWRLYSSSKTIAWKTGTSFGHKDAWAIGVTPDYTVGVWVGNADGEGRPGLTGASAAAPLLFNVFKQLQGNSWFEKPEANLMEIAVCKTSGYKASPLCPQTDTISATMNAYKTIPCPYHEKVFLDKSAAFRVNADCYRVNDMQMEVWFVLPPVMEWYYKSKNPHYKKLPPLMPECVAETNNLEIIYPQAHAKLFIPRSFKGRKEHLVFEATHRLPNTKLFWHLDDQFIASTTFQHQIEVQPDVGEHILTVVSEDGEVISRPFEVIAR